MKIKICGMREPGNIREIGALEPDWMGFIFYPPSPRYAASLDPGELAGALPAPVRRTGVFVDETEAQIRKTARRYGLHALQLHGHESPELCRRLREEGWEVIKSFPVAAAADLAACRRYENVCDYFLFDAKTPLFGGSGRGYDWEILAAYAGRTPFLLSGGIGGADAERIGRFVHPRWAGIDLNSRFETAPGRKDAAALKRFLQALDRCGAQNQGIE